MKIKYVKIGNVAALETAKAFIIRFNNAMLKQWSNLNTIAIFYLNYISLILKKYEK